jgi:mRNA-degrading endonuclease RelE of RelBE toxin-antitoxin system
MNYQIEFKPRATRDVESVTSKMQKLPYEEYEQLLSLLEDLEDLHELRIAKRAESDAPSLSLEEVKKHLGNLKISALPVPNASNFS